jgi:hypothetical protein
MQQGAGLWADGLRTTRAEGLRALQGGGQAAGCAELAGRGGGAAHHLRPTCSRRHSSRRLALAPLPAKHKQHRTLVLCSNVGRRLVSKAHRLGYGVAASVLRNVVHSTGPAAIGLQP